MLTTAAPTSIDCFHDRRSSGVTAAQRGRVLAFIQSHGGDWSIGELASALYLQKSTVSARVHELLYETHDLVEMPKRKDKCSGVLVRPVGLPVRGQMRLI